MLFLLTTFALESRCKITKKNRTDKIIFCQSIKYMKRVALKWNPYGVRGEGDGRRLAIEMEPLWGSERGRWVEGGY